VILLFVVSKKGFEYKRRWLEVGIRSKFDIKCPIFVQNVNFVIANQLVIFLGVVVMCVVIRALHKREFVNKDEQKICRSINY